MEQTDSEGLHEMAKRRALSSLDIQADACAAVCSSISFDRHPRRNAPPRYINL